MGWRLAAIAGVTLAAAALLFYLASQANRAPMALLFSGLDSRDSAAIVQRLEQANVPYELRGDGSTIMVPEDQALRLRMDMAGSGLPAGGGVGYEIFDRQDALGVTSFQQNINRLRALEGELGRTIRALDRVEQARVHLVIPERQLFAENAAVPTASIIVRARGRLTPEQVQAIQHLVASAVEGLSAARISVIDERGELLAGGDGEATGAAAQTAQAERQAAYEERVRRQVEEIVASIAGPGRARVQVTAEMDFSRLTREQVTYDPDGQVVRSVQSRAGATDSTTGESTGSVSVSESLPDAGGEGGSETNRESNSTSDETTNYEISSTKETEVIDGGRVTRLSVAVAVDGVWTASTEGARSYAPRNAEDMDKIAALVRSAIGFDEKRGDKVEVLNVQFAQEAATELAPVEEPFLGLTKGDYFRMGEYAVFALVALLTILMVFRPLVARLGAPIIAGTQAQGQIAGPAAQSAAAALPAPSGESAPALPSPRNKDLMIDIAQVEGQVRESSVKKVGDLVGKHPDEAVSIMRQWLQEAT